VARLQWRGAGVKRFVHLLVVMVALAGVPAAAQQGPTSSQRFNAWRLDCFAPKEKPTEGVAALEAQQARSNCQMQQEIRLQSDPSKVAAIVRVRLLGADRQPFLLFVLPPNAQADLGISYAIDGAEPFKVRIRECTAQQCVAALLLDGQRLYALRNGKQITVGFKVGGTSIAAVIALDGFAAAYAGLAGTAAAPAAN
jgi:invasion protein IalB